MSKYISLKPNCMNFPDIRRWRMNQRMCPETNETATCSLSHTKHILPTGSALFLELWYYGELELKPTCHWYDKEKGGCLPYKHSSYNSPSPCGRGCCSHCRTGTYTANSWSACSRPSSERTGTCSEDMLREDEIRAKTGTIGTDESTHSNCVWWGKLTDVQTEEPNMEMKLVVVVLGRVSGKPY